MATEVLNAEARGEGPTSPFRLRNATEQLPVVTSLWEPPITTKYHSPKDNFGHKPGKEHACSVRAGLPSSSILSIITECLINSRYYAKGPQTSLKFICPQTLHYRVLGF